MSGDRSYRSYNKESGNVYGEVLDPEKDGWIPGTWTDTAHFSDCLANHFKGFVIHGGVEDATDFNNRCHEIVVSDFTLYSGGRYCITLKGGSHDNEFENILIGKHGRQVDIEVGNWSDQSRDNNTNNTFNNVQSVDGKPVTYCYRLGSRPKFINSNVKHLWWRSLGITLYWWAKLVYVTIFNKKVTG